MRGLFVTSLAAVVLGLAGGMVAAQSTPADEAELAGLLEGWVEAGPSQRCLNFRRAGSIRIVNRTAIVYRIGNTLYVNRPTAGAERLDRRDAIVNRRGLPTLCEGEMIELTDPFSEVVRLARAGPFVPYRRSE
ncbi:hypothetical protein [Sphingosinicella sp.]|uniref:hypothetical protein n=1 Tax=Sphingosinicella sp. TaxID=1917971 RepID=UPI004038351E